MTPLHWFLGANSPGGFTGYLDNVYDSSWRVWLIKGGPGCGKSGLLHKIAQRAPGAWELVHCSSDPASLDAILDTRRKILLADATPPHALAPRWPGCCEQLIDLSAGFHTVRLQKNAAAITALFAACARQHRQAQQLLGAAAALKQAQAAAAPQPSLPLAQQIAEQIARQVAEPCPAPLPEGAALPAGVAQRRGLCAVTPEGTVFFSETVHTLADRIFLLQDDFGAAAPLVMRCLYERLQACPTTLTVCKCSLFPGKDDPPEHILLPELRVAILTDGAAHPWQPLSREQVHPIALASVYHNQNAPATAVTTAAPGFYAQQTAAVLQQAADCMRQAKQLHDALEQYYIDAMDFTVVERAAEKIIQEIASCR